MTELNYQTAAGTDDGYWASVYYYHNQVFFPIGRVVAGIVKAYSRWDNVEIPLDSVILNSYVSFCHYGHTGTPPACSLYFEDASDPAYIESYTDGNLRSPTTNYISITGPTDVDRDDWWNSGDISTIIQELVDSYDYSAGNHAMQMIIVGAGSSGDNYTLEYEYDNGTHVQGPKLYIEYELPSGDVGLISRGLCGASPLLSSPLARKVA